MGKTMSTSLDDWIKEAKGRCDAATEGPWNWEDWDQDDGPDPCNLVAPPHTREGGENKMFPDLGNSLLDCEESPAKEVMDFIAHSRTDLPKALRIIEVLLAELVEGECLCEGTASSHKCDLCRTYAKAEEIANESTTS